MVKCHTSCVNISFKLVFSAWLMDRLHLCVNCVGIFGNMPSILLGTRGYAGISAAISGTNTHRDHLVENIVFPC